MRSNAILVRDAVVVAAATALVVWSWRPGADADPARESTARSLVRGIGRPFALPFLWNDVDTAERTGDVAAALYRIEAIARWLPHWTDGQALVAWRVATARGNRAAPQTAAGRAARIATALAWLDERAASAATPAARADLWSVGAMLLQSLTEGEAVRSALTDLLGESPLAGVDRRLEAAAAADPSPVRQERRAFLVFDLLATSLRGGGPGVGEPGVVRRLVEVGTARLDRLGPDETVRRARAALDALAAYLDRPDAPAARVALERAAADNEYLEELAPLLLR